MRFLRLQNNWMGEWKCSLEYFLRSCPKNINLFLILNKTFLSPENFWNFLLFLNVYYSRLKWVGRRYYSLILFSVVVHIFLKRIPNPFYPVYFSSKGVSYGQTEIHTLVIQIVILIITYSLLINTTFFRISFKNDYIWLWDIKKNSN